MKLHKNLFKKKYIYIYIYIYICHCHMLQIIFKKVILKFYNKMTILLLLHDMFFFVFGYHLVIYCLLKKSVIIDYGEKLLLKK